MSTELTSYQPQAVELTMSRTTSVVLKEAEQAASALIKVVKDRNLFKRIGTRDHLFVEAWETVGHFYRCHARVVDVQPIEIGKDFGFRAQAELVHMDTGHVLSSAFALCMTDEEDWRERPKYKWENNVKTLVGTEPVSHHARASMAQTRARSKVFRGVFDVVAVLAGYDPTPAEEMDGGGGQGSRKPPVQQPQRKAGVISEKQAKRLYAISRKAEWSKEEMTALLKQFGYDSSKDIEQKDYDAIVGRVEAGDKATTEKPPQSSAENGSGQWRSDFADAAQQADIEAWLKGAHKLTTDAARDLFFAKWDGEASDALEEAARWLEAHQQGSLGV